MKKGIININNFATAENTVESYVSLKKFAEFLEHKVQNDKSIRAHFFRFVLDKVNQYPELREGLPATELTSKYDEVLELVSTIVLPLVEDDNVALVGLTSGVSPVVFYGTEAFAKLFDYRTQAETEGKLWINKQDSLQLHRRIQYYLILQKVYGYELPQKREVLHSFFNPTTGLYQYFRLNIDTRFVEITARQKKDTIDWHSLNSCVHSSDKEAAVEKMFPLSNYVAKGFTIITLTDITAQQSIEQMSKIVTSVDKKDAEEDFTHITRLMQTIVGSSHYRFGIMPFFTINNRAALLYDNFPYSLLIKASSDAGIQKAVFTRYINHYIKNPRFIIYRSSNPVNTLPVPVQEALKKSGIHFYMLMPIFFNDTLVGILETGAGKDVPELTDFQMGKLKPAIPYISQLLKLLIDRFNISIDAIVKEKFTVIQPAVQWKFNEVAWHYFRNYNIEHRNSTLEKISFKHVYPLYGAVDIRNSTIERNKALRQDLQLQLQLLLELLNKLYASGITGDILILAETTRQWLVKLTAYVSIEDELELNNFLFGKVHTLLGSLLEQLPAELAADINNYHQAIDEETGICFSKRRSLESSIKLLNETISNHFDTFREDLQHSYPSYFEKFRTDGIEYDIYIGQSIAPKIPFSMEAVEELRKWQVQSMAAVAKHSHALLDKLENRLQTTQLIFVNARPIDISFRNDERRFDVEGAYNIRYHIIKKRIDKVNVYGTLERLTQPGKIAIVYFNERDAAEYITYIEALQREGILLNDLEHLDLEELQGVTGLKALRVGVRLSE